MFLEKGNYSKIGRGILDFLTRFYKEKVIIAEAACGDAMEAYKNFDYFSLRKEYDVELIDLNRGPFEVVTILDRGSRPIHVRLSSLLMDRNNYLISAARLKTHDRVVDPVRLKS